MADKPVPAAKPIDQLTREDFLDTYPYELIFNEPDDFKRTTLIERLRYQADKVGYKKFVATMKAYGNSLKQIGAQQTVIRYNPTHFEGQPVELDAGSWTALDDRIERPDGNKTAVACMHPILPIERLVNVDTGEQRSRLAFRVGGRWSEVVVERTVLASASKVTELARYGIAITSQNARDFIQYLSEIETINYKVIKESKSVGRLGFISEKEFSPYMGELYFDGDAAFGQLFRSVHSRGSLAEWKNVAIECRQQSIAAAIVLAASFASVLLDKLNALPFFVHLWGVDSGTGKTVALMLAASVWGNPALGEYVKTFDSTVVGMEKTAAFLNSLPLCLDELQLSKDGRGKSSFDVYRLAQGVGRTRGNKYGGVDQTPRWRNCILTTGESPITSLASGAGAVNRVLDIECVTGHPVITDGNRISNALRANYGQAGRMFVDHLIEADMDSIRTMYRDYFEELNQSDSTEKQAMAAAAVLTADQLMCAWVFDSEIPSLEVRDIREYMASREEVSAGQRAYESLCGWVAQNVAHFTSDNPNGVYGRLTEKDPDHVYIIATLMRETLREQGFDPRATASWLRQKKLIEGRGRNMTRAIKIGRVPTECFYLKLPPDESQAPPPEEDGGELPF